jgi:hypothetical protein
MKRATFLTAVVLYLALNVLILPLVNFGFNQYDYAYRNWPWWAVYHLRSTRETFNVALLGSSLMLGSLNQCDSNFTLRNVDATSHHKSVYLEHSLKENFGGEFKTVNLATPGQTPSDAYLLTKTMLTLGQHPKLIIYGIAPRDFMDNRLLNPADTEPFRYLKRFVPMQEIASDVYQSPLSSLDYWLQNDVYLYEHAMDVQIAFTRRLNSTLERLLPAPVNGVSFSYWDRIKLLPKYKASELRPGDSVNTPIISGVPEGWQRDNVEDYVERYRKPNSQSFNLQLKFLKREFTLCHENNIDLVLVNMPLSSININLLGRRRYENFSDIVGHTSLLRGVRYIDLGSTKSFPIALFQDSAHLTGAGAKQFIDLLTESMKKDAGLSEVIERAGKPFSEKRAIAIRNHVSGE